VFAGVAIGCARQFLDAKTEHSAIRRFNRHATPLTLGGMFPIGDMDRKTVE
jgi:hypothetical protein